METIESDYERSKNKDGGDAEVNPVQSLKTIRDLPEEILAQIFGHLTHTQKLVSRLVCKEWNEQISSDLPKTSYFDLTSRDSNETLLQSNVEWTHIKISDCSHSVLPKQFKKSITALQLDLHKFGSTSLIKFLISFPSLTELQVIINEENDKCEDPFPQEPNPASQLRTLRPDFLDIMEKLKELSLTFPHNNYKALNEFLQELTNEKMCLTKLYIVESLGLGESLPKVGGSSEGVLTHLNRIITTSSQTLTYLRLDFRSDDIMSKLIPDLISKLSEVKNLILQTALIGHDPPDEHIERDFAILQEFLNIQMTTGMLKKIALPLSSNVSLCQDFISSLPPDIECVVDAFSPYITQQFPSNFKKLRYLSLADGISSALEMSNENIKILNTFHWNIANRMPNLSYLQITGNGSITFCDMDLHNITEELKQLRVLHLESCQVTDCGVTGLEDDDDKIEQVYLRTKRLYFYPECFADEDLIKKPISSLRKLEQLVLTGSKITDVGIVLGFQFGSRLKKLILGSKSDKVSDLGLHCLGTNNPGLEVFDGSFMSPQISITGIANLKRQLPLIQSTQKFKFLNKPS